MNRKQLASLLPDVVRRTDRDGSPTRALLEIAVDLLAPVEAELDHVHDNFSARGTRDRFVGMLAQWLDVERLLRDADGTLLAREPALAAAATLPSGLGRLRELVAAAADLARWRGTRRGLLRALERATGLGGFVVEETPESDVGPRAFFFRVTAPAQARRYAALVRRILELEKPAYVQCELRFAAAAARDAAAAAERRAGADADTDAGASAGADAGGDADADTSR